MGRVQLRSVEQRRYVCSWRSRRQLRVATHTHIRGGDPARVPAVGRLRDHLLWFSCRKYRDSRAKHADAGSDGQFGSVVAETSVKLTPYPFFIVWLIHSAISVHSSAARLSGSRSAYLP